MRILVFQQAAWEETNAVGNTLSNWFGGWNEDQFANFYTRKQVPDNDIVSHYYSISAADIVKEVFKKKKHSFYAAEIAERKDSIELEHGGEQKSIDRLHSRNNDIVYWGMETVWRSGCWINKEFKRFVKEFDPDILFAFCANVYILKPLMDYISTNTSAKTVLFIADDIYADYLRKPFFRRSYLTRLCKACIQKADKLYGCSQELCDHYSEMFSRQVSALYKGVRVEFGDIKEAKKPLRIVYAGNLYYGRRTVLVDLADALDSLNVDEPKAELEVYTGATLSDEIVSSFEKRKSVRLMGKRTYSDVKRILTDADIVLHVESFEQSQIDRVKYSFSTKIIDCLGSGSMILAIGPAEDASISYIGRIPGAQVITSRDDMAARLTRVLDMDNDERNRQIEATRRFAESHDGINQVRERLRKDFLELIAGNASVEK